MSAYALGGHAGWQAAHTTGLAVGAVLEATGDGTYRSEALDSRLPGCRWDRVGLAAHLAGGASLAISTYASDADRGDAALDALGDGDWSPWSLVPGPIDGTTDVPVRAGPGRYLWIRIALTGTADEPASLRSMDVTFPRATSMRLLPAVYSTDEGGRDLNERLLSVFDAMRDEVKAEIRCLASVIDPRTTDAATRRDFLDWLATWFGIEVFRAWPERRRRAVIEHAGELFRERGTCRGIRRFIELGLGREVTIIEDWAQRHWWFAAENRLGCAVLFQTQTVDAEHLATPATSTASEPFAVSANRMTVFVRYRDTPTQDEITMLRAVVDVQKPAHVAPCLVFVEPDLRLGITARLGLDSVVGMLRPPAVLAGCAPPRLGVNATVGVLS